MTTKRESILTAIASALIGTVTVQELAAEYDLPESFIEALQPAA